MLPMSYTGGSQFSAAYLAHHQQNGKPRGGHAGPANEYDLYNYHPSALDNFGRPAARHQHHNGGVYSVSSNMTPPKMPQPDYDFEGVASHPMADRHPSGYVYQEPVDAVECRGLMKTYGRGKGKMKALNNVNMNVEQGSM